MNLLALSFTAAQLRDFQAVLLELGTRGHRVEVVLRPDQREGARPLLERLRQDCPRIEETALRPRRGWWWPVADELRRRRAARGAEGAVGRLLERALPPDPGLLALISRSAPDVVLVLAGETAGPAAEEAVKAARHLACRTAVAVEGAPGAGGAPPRVIEAERVLDWPAGPAAGGAAGAGPFADALEAVAEQPARPWRTPRGAALLRAAAAPFVAGRRRRILAREHGMWRGIERLERPRAAMPDDAAGQPLEQAIARGARRTDRALAALARSRRPILIGPWTGRPEAELLYWIPFLTWARHAYRLAPERLVVVSRPGTRHWYGALADRHLPLRVDEAAEGAAEAAARDLARRELGIGGPDLLHPGILLDGVLRHHQSQLSPIDHLLSHAVYEPLPAPEPGELEARLPGEFYAVRFVAGAGFADSAGNRALAARMLERLVERGSVMLLDTAEGASVGGDGLLEEALASGRFGNRVLRSSELAEGAETLDLQTRVIARARGFFGSHGTASYLAPFLGKPSVSFHDRAEALAGADLATAGTVFRSFGVPFVTLSGADLALAGDLL